MNNNEARIFYFSADELLRLRSFDNRRLLEVQHLQWVNKTNPGDIFEFTFAVTLIFDNGRLTLSADEDNMAILPGDSDFEKKRYELLHAFNGSIDLRSDTMNGNALWAPVIGETLLSIELVKEEDLYRSDSLLLNFGKEKIVIALGMEGLAIEPYEEV
jgi:hypothetical protein